MAHRGGGASGGGHAPGDGGPWFPPRPNAPRRLPVYDYTGTVRRLLNHDAEVLPIADADAPRGFEAELGSHGIGLRVRDDGLAGWLPPVCDGDIVWIDPCCRVPRYGYPHVAVVVEDEGGAPQTVVAALSADDTLWSVIVGSQGRKVELQIKPARVITVSPVVAVSPKPFRP